MQSVMTVVLNVFCDLHSCLLCVSKYIDMLVNATCARFVSGVSRVPSIACTFENSLCGFKNDPNSNIKWNVKRPIYRGTNVTANDDVRGL